MDRLEVKVGSGFDFWGVASANDGLEIGSEPEVFEPAIDPIVVGAGDDGAGDILLLEMGQGLANSRNRIELADFLSDRDVASRVDSFPIEIQPGERFEVGFRRPSVEVRPDALHVGLEGEFLSVLEKKVAPGFVNGPLGIENHSVEIEENGARVEGVRHY